MIRDLEDDDEPLCDISGDCEPLDGEENNASAMCRHCGGTRYKDSPFPGNWGTEPKDGEP